MAGAERGIETPSGRLLPGTTEPIDAATVLLLRDGRDGLEVFLLERHLASDFAGGAFAFPGGKVDEVDAQLPPHRWAGIDPAVERDRVGVASPAAAVALWVAAVRETFEEAGLLLATRSDGSVLTAADVASDSFLDARARLAARGAPWDWRPWLEAEDLVLDLGALALFSWWVTPHGMHKRYNTRFLAAAAPEAQMAALGHDDVETTASLWSRPATALAAAARGEAVIIFPTRRNLEALTGYDTAAAVVDAGRARRTDQRRILPGIVLIDGVAHVRHPDGGAPETI